MLERHENINSHPKSRSVSRRTMEIMRGLGVDDEQLVPISLPPSGTHVLVLVLALLGVGIFGKCLE